MPPLIEQEKQEIFRYIDADKPLPESCRILPFAEKREIIRAQNPEMGGIEKQCYGDSIFENEWQSFRTRKDRRMELTSVAREVPIGHLKVAVKVVDIFGNDTMNIIEEIF